MSEEEDTNEYAPEFVEKQVPLQLDEIGVGTMEYNHIDITYHARKNTRTVRSLGATSWKNKKHEVSFYDGGKKYVFNTESLTLWVLYQDGSRKKVADRDSIEKIEKVSFPKKATVVGEGEEGVKANVYYYSAQSGNLKSTSIQVELVSKSMASGVHEVQGTEINGEGYIKAEVYDTREMVRTTSRETLLGRVARVEFPETRSVEIEVSGLGIEEFDVEARGRIESAVEGAVEGENVSAKVLAGSENE